MDGQSNIGMHSVDFALHNILSERGLADEVLLSRLWSPQQDGRESADVWPMKFNSDTLSSCPVSDSRGRVFWGDFQHGHNYLAMSARRLQQVATSRYSSDLSAEQYLDECYRHFMLEDVIDDLPSTTVGMFGGTLFQNRPIDYLNDRYRRALEALYRRADYVQVRDPYSATKVGQIRGDLSANYLGTDAALLNKPEELLSLEQTTSDSLSSFEGSVGVFIGRSTSSFPHRHVGSFILRLANRLQANVSWVPWDFHGRGLFASNRRPLAWYVRDLRQKADVSCLLPGDIFRIISSLRLIVTDTYHLALNAIVLGIPCVCIYEPSPAADRNANMGFHTAWRDKRVLQFLTFDLSDWLVPTTDVQSEEWAVKRCYNICALVEDPRAVDASHEGLRTLAADCRRRVGDFLEQVCARSPGTGAGRQKQPTAASSERNQ